jgi:macrophage erythroblast attacher
LKKLNSNFEFYLNLQEFVELIKENKKKEAILYSRKYFSVQKENIDQIQRAMALLAFGKDVTLEPYKVFQFKFNKGIIFH